MGGVGRNARGGIGGEHPCAVTVTPADGIARLPQPLHRGDARGGVGGDIGLAQRSGVGARLALGGAVGIERAVEIDQRLRGQDPLARGASGEGRALDRREHRQQRAGTGVIAGIRPAERGFHQVLRHRLAQCGGEAEAPRGELFDRLPLDLHRPLPASGSARKAARQQHVDARRNPAEQRAVEQRGGQRALARIGVADRLHQLPLAIIAGRALQAHRWAGAGDVARTEIGGQRLGGQRR